MLLLPLAFVGKSSLIFPLQTKLSSPLSAGSVLSLTSHDPHITNQSTASLCPRGGLKDKHRTQAVRGFPQVPGPASLLAGILHFQNISLVLQ